MVHGWDKPGPREDFFFERTTQKNYSFTDAYNRSKLANLFFTQSLARYLESKGIMSIKVVALHPGVVLTSFQADLKSNFKTVAFACCLFYPFFWIFTKSQFDGS